MRKTIFSKKAEKDLIEIYRYGFLNHDEQKAELYIESLKEKCQVLADNPFLYRERKEFTPPVRIYHHKKHLIIYTVETNHILIVRIQHERMDIQKHLEI
jgi:toxin ParE1/3/4